jgi:hypothetical protein
MIYSNKRQSLSTLIYPLFQQKKIMSQDVIIRFLIKNFKYEKFLFKKYVKK